MKETFLDVQIEKGKLRFIDESRTAKLLSALQDGRYTAMLQLVSFRRSPAQNRMMFGLAVRSLVEYTGYPEKELWEVLKKMFNPKTIVLCDANGEIKAEVQIGDTTRFLSKTDFSTMYDSIIRFAAELGCVVPDPASYGRGLGL